uniref:EamA domain-containing protein n=1 Tax=Alexandrium monilatum TaxID=311494 RepID=A0A7S4PVW2_9DINO
MSAQWGREAGGATARRGAGGPEAPSFRSGACEGSDACGQGGWWRPSALAPVLALLSCVLYCVNGELLQALQTRTSASEGHPSPLLNLVLCHLGGLAFAPHFLGKPPPVAPAAGPVTAAGGLAAHPRSASLLLTLVLMGYNYAWLMSARFLAAALTNAIFQTSIALVYLASVLLFGEPLTLLRFVGVFLSLAGSALASGLGPGAAALSSGTTGLDVRAGVALALMASVGVTVYQVLVRHWYGHLKHDVRFLAYFGAWVSVWHLLAVLPLVLLAHLAGVEELCLPRGWFAVVGTAVSATIASTVNGLYLCVVMWGSPMLLPCASAFSVPLTVALDSVLHGVRLGAAETLGHTMVLLSVVLIMELQHVARALLDPPGVARKLSSAPPLPPAA